MNNAPQPRPVAHRPGGLIAVVAGIAALGGAGTLAAVLPVGPVPVRHPVVVADAAAMATPSTTTTTGTAGRTRGGVVVGGEPPAPSPITTVF